MKKPNFNMNELKRGLASVQTEFADVTSQQKYHDKYRLTLDSDEQDGVDPYDYKHAKENYCLGQSESQDGAFEYSNKHDASLAEFQMKLGSRINLSPCPTDRSDYHRRPKSGKSINEKTGRNKPN